MKGWTNDDRMMIACNAPALLPIGQAPGWNP